MPPTTPPREAETSDPIEIDLKDPALAAFLAWLIPGAGHFYQGRTAKGVLFLTCILGTFIFGMVLGNCRVVYAQWKPFDKRWAYFCQFPAGLAALPALVPVSERYEAPDKVRLDQLHHEMHRFFELGTVFTMIAGLLNILAIYDAWGGPVIVEPSRGNKRARPPNDGEDEDLATPSSDR